jgi:hypothetical protein
VPPRIVGVILDGRWVFDRSPKKSIGLLARLDEVFGNLPL